MGFTLASVGIPVRLQGTLWSVALSMAFKVLLGWGMFSLANMNSGSNQASWWERKWLCSQNYLSPLSPPLSQTVCSFRHFWGTFLHAGPSAWLGGLRDGQDSPTRSSCSVGRTMQVTAVYSVTKATAGKPRGCRGMGEGHQHRGSCRR